MYLLLKHFHIGCVLLSAGGFALRGVWSLGGSPLLRARLTRVLPHIVDTALLASAIALAVMAGQYPFVNAWLSAKVGGLIAYIALGSVALKPARPLPARAAAFVAALLVLAWIVSVALTKNPLGWLAVL